MSSYKPSVTRVVVDGLSYEQLQLSPKIKLRYPPRMSPKITYNGKTTHVKLTPGPRDKVHPVARDRPPSESSDREPVAPPPAAPSRVVQETSVPAPAPPIQRKTSNASRGTYRTETTVPRPPTMHIPSQRSVRSNRSHRDPTVAGGESQFSPTRSHFFTPEPTQQPYPPSALRRINTTSPIPEEGQAGPSPTTAPPPGSFRKGHAPAYLFDNSGEMRALSPQEIRKAAAEATPKPSRWRKVKDVFLSKKKKKERAVVEAEKNRPVSFWYAASDPAMSVHSPSRSVHSPTRSMHSPPPSVHSRQV